MTTELATITQGPLAGFDSRTVDLVRGIVAKDLDDLSLAFFLRDCQRRGLDPLARQAYAFKGRGGAVTTIIGIDGFRALAEATGEYRGRLGPFFRSTDGGEWTEQPVPDLAFAKVGVSRQGFDAPVWAVASLAEMRKPTDPWRRMPGVMLAKCAEAQALRAAFPRTLSGAYTQEEIDTGEARQVRQEHPADEFIDVLLDLQAAVVTLSMAWKGRSARDVFDGIVVPKAKAQATAINRSFIESLVVDARERIALRDQDIPTATEHETS